MINLIKYPRTGMSFSTNDFFGPMESVINSLFNDALETLPGAVRSVQHGRLYPKTDIYRDSNSLVFEAAVPFLKKEDLVVEIADGNVLTITGECEKEDTSESREYFRKELRRSKFVRSFTLPDFVMSNHTDLSANFEDGVLRVVFHDAYSEPEVPEKKTKIIDVK